jgi:AcrR family transcriptional regulator
MATDRRVRYTKMVLRESLIKLLQDKPISRITIKEICDDADINRTTYYSHYTDQFDQLKHIELEFISDINSYLDNFNINKGDSDLVILTEKIFEYLNENGELCRVLLGKNGDMDFQTNMLKIISKRIIDEWQKIKYMEQSASEYTYTFISTGCIGVIKKWLFEDSGHTPGEMAMLITQLTNNALKAYDVHL